MHIEAFREYCLSFQGVTEEMPFDEEVLFFKVMGKIFAITNLNHFESITVKCDPEIALELREKYAAVTPGYHSNKKHWNTIILDGELTDQQLQHWITHSYEQVVRKLPKKLRQELQ